MNCLRNYVFPLLAGAIAVSLSSCTSLDANTKSDRAGWRTVETVTSLVGSTKQVASSTQSTTQPPLAPLTSTLSPRSTPLKASNSKAAATAPSSNTVSLTIYQADSRCQNLVPEKVAVPAEKPVEAAVGRVLKQADSGDFDLAGYRVKVNTKTGVATVDLRRLPNSQRQFVSLSACEQFALFGSLRKTLTANSKLKIKDVRFTEQGKKIEF